MALDNLSLILIGITLLFFILLFVKSLFKNKKKFCMICLSVSLIWITLLILYYFNIFTDKLIIAILMGHTSLGIFYLLEKKVKKELLFFRLPYLLTSISLIYFILSDFIINSLYVLFGLWLLFIVIYLFKNKGFSKKIIECCKKW